MHRRVLPEHGREIGSRNHVGKFDHLDVVALPEQRPTFWRERFSDEDFLLVGRHFLPWVPLFARQRTTPVPSFSRCILLRSTANRMGAPSLAPAPGLTRPQICV